MFGNTDVYVLDYTLRILKDKADVTEPFAVIIGIGCAYANETSLLGVKKDRTTVQNISSRNVQDGTSLPSFSRVVGQADRSLAWNLRHSVFMHSVVCHRRMLQGRRH